MAGRADLTVDLETTAKTGSG